MQHRRACCISPANELIPKNSCPNSTGGLPADARTLSRFVSGLKKNLGEIFWREGFRDRQAQVGLPSECELLPHPFHSLIKPPYRWKAAEGKIGESAAGPIRAGSLANPGDLAGVQHPAS